MQIKRFSVLFLYCLIVLLTAVKGYNDDRKSADPSFRSMLRYGRSSSNNKEDTPKETPRARAFFFGPRYGKRSASPNIGKHAIGSNFSEKDKRLSCSWIGLSDLYRCTRRQSIVN